MRCDIAACVDIVTFYILCQFLRPHLLLGEELSIGQEQTRQGNR